MVYYLLVILAGLLIFGLMSFGALQYALLQGKKTHLQGREDRLLSLLKENKAAGVAEPLSEQLKNYALVTHEGNLFHVHNLDGTFLFPSEDISHDWALIRKTARNLRLVVSLSIGNRPSLCAI
jgi:two-component system, OmpR family, heavy metal sensor histidine kinase CusS